MIVEFIEPGAKVTMIGGIKGKVSAVMIEDGPRVSYKVIWPNGQNLEEKWIPAFAIEPPEEHRMKGFGKG